MKWILILVTFYQPNVKVGITEQEYPSEASCLAKMAEYTEMWEKAEDSSFNYTMRCEQRQKP